MLFERKKIQTEILSEFLKSARVSLELTLEEVSKKTGIKLKFLEALELGEFKSLPADVYVFGFLRQLAVLYSADPDELVAQFKKEKGISQQIARSAGQATAAWQRRFLGKMVVTPKIISLVGSMLFVALTVAYIVWQVLSINKTPGLTVFSPQNNSVISGSSTDVAGQTDPSAQVTVNKENVFVDAKGKFETQIGLTPGPKTIVVTASNRFGKTASQSINITSSAVASSTPLSLKIDLSAAVTLNAAIDDQSSQTFSFNSGDSKVFTAAQKIVISTSNAGATVVWLDGQNLGPMGKSKEPLNNVSFFAPALPTSIPAPK
ncbi:MAG: helix-turn-helix domain-containing protein [Candidatus Doudnabacteria bacterium]|nr:helix-turn-helix domain-containing protein [Candidatus Doudnabacteria bacterium]